MPTCAAIDAVRAPALAIENVEIGYSDEAHAEPVLAIPHFAVSPAAHVGITGPSGSGKTTLLHLMVGIELPRVGSVRWGATDITRLSDGQRARWRRGQVGMVFQDFQLLGALSALDNVLLPWQFDHLTVPAGVRARAARLLDGVGVRKARLAKLLSRGEQQRIAVARALLRQPSILVADEPTASLDVASSRAIADLLVEAAREAKAVLIVVSHDPVLLERLASVHRLAGGRFVEAANSA